MEAAQQQLMDPDSEAELSREERIRKYLPFVKHLVHRLVSHLPASVEMDDLLNVGVIGLMSAVDRYDPSRNVKFSTYAATRIRGEVMTELRNRDFLSRDMRRRCRQYERVLAALKQEMGRPVEDAEVAEEMGVDVAEVLELKRNLSLNFVSFDEIEGFTEDEREGLLKGWENGGTADPQAETLFKELESGLAGAIEDLPKRQRLVVSLYYWDELTMKEIGQVLEITESRVSQIHSEAVLRLRGRLRSGGYISS